MNARLSFNFAAESSGGTARLDDLSVVKLRRDVDAAEGRVPAGTSGTIVNTYRNGEAYCVEIVSPFQAFLHLNQHEIEAAD